MDLKIAPLLKANSGDSIILQLHFGSAVEAESCDLEIREFWDALTNIRSRVNPITDANCIRTVIWLDRGEGFKGTESIDRTIRLHVSKNSPITLSGIQFELLKNEP